jgi:hypothetical protein
MKIATIQAYFLRYIGCFHSVSKIKNKTLNSQGYIYTSEIQSGENTWLTQAARCEYFYQQALTKRLADLK